MLCWPLLFVGLKTTANIYVHVGAFRDRKRRKGCRNKSFTPKSQKEWEGSGSFLVESSATSLNDGISQTTMGPTVR